MRNRIVALQTLGVVLSLTIALVPSAMAAWDPATLAWNPGQDIWDLLLIGSLTLLVIGVALKLIQRKRISATPRVNTGSRYFGPQFFPALEDDARRATEPALQIH